MTAIGVTQRRLQRDRDGGRADIPDLHFVLWYNDTER
jgi:hypothetical protein